MIKPKIAFCFSWQARTLDQTYPLLKKNLFDIAKKQWFNFDIFCAVEDDADAEKVQLLHPLKIEKIKSNDVAKLIQKKYPHLNLLYQNYYILYQHETTLLQKSLINYLQQYYKVQRAIELKSRVESTQGFKYVLVIRLRFDYWLSTCLDFKKILKTLGEKTILCQQLTYRRFTLCPIADFFFLGNSQTMDIFGKHFDRLMDSFTGHHVISQFRPLLWWLRLLDLLNYKLNNFFATNNLLRILAIIITKYFFHCYCAEMIIYDYLKYHHIKILRDTFSFRIIRRNWNDMVFSFKKCIHEKNNF